MRKHICECPGQPDCEPHKPVQYGGGEPDICEAHDHQSAAEARARTEIMRVMERFTPEQQRRIFFGAITKLASDD